jgi:hypothetical protein
MPAEKGKGKRTESVLIFAWGKLGLWGEIDHKDIIKHGLQEGNKSLVVRVREVKGPGLFTFKTYDKAMSEFFIQCFRAVILPPFQGNNSRYFGGKSGEFLFDMGNLSGIGVLLELKADDVSNDFAGITCGDWGIHFEGR